MKEAQDVIENEIKGMAPACKAGCSWCCHQLVVLTCRADGEMILKTVKDRLSHAEFDEFADIVRRQAGEINALPHSEAEKKRWPCPLLRDGRCLAYDVRPVACRSVFSPDSECCRAMFHAATYNDLPPQYRPLAQAISEKAIRIQIIVNNRRPIDGAIELRTLLLELMEKGTHHE